MKVHRKYKDSTFRLIFVDEPENATSLCNSTSEETFDAKDIIFDPIGGIFIDEFRHDFSCRFGNRNIFIHEHQSSRDENIPIRMFIEAAEVYERYIKSLGPRAIHRKTKIILPSIEFILLCNGRATGNKDISEMHLIDSFRNSKGIDLTVKVYNISYDPNREILKKCKPLMDYSRLVHQVELGKEQGLSNEKAIKDALVYCRDNDILTDFLNKHKEEVEQVMMFEWNIDDVIAASREDGLSQGLSQGIFQERDATVLEMLRENEPPNKIMRYTRVSPERLAELRQMV